MTRQPQRACHDSLFDEAELDQVLAVQSNQPSIQSIQGRSQVQADGLIRALRCIPDATNNLAERELRPMVLMRKNSNGSNTFTGMETSAIVASVVQTIAKRDAPALSSLLHPFNKASRTSLPSIDMRAPLTPPSSAFDQSWITTFRGSHTDRVVNTLQTEADGNIDVYVPLGKDYPLFLAVPCMLPFIAWVGVLTAILGGAAALVEVDLKRMLA